MELICKVQNYHWGKKGNNSLVAKLAHANSGIEIENDKTYAELWMGTHPSCPSVLKSTNTSLSQHLSKNPSELGSKVVELFGNQLPFLFKVLSVQEALSIQAHPTKEHAELLYKDFPTIYKDGNHKPELAIALTEFEALCGFRPLSEIKFYLSNVPEFKLVIESEKIDKLVNEENENVENMKDCFKSLMSSAQSDVKTALDKLISRLDGMPEPDKATYHVDLVKKIQKQYPGDVGVFCIYWLNYLKLSPGDALYLAPNEPHAYLYGDCVECMSNSDNVVRAGLTPKFRDVSTLCRMLTYKNYKPSEICFKPEMEDEFSEIFKPPINEFAVAEIKLPKGSKYNTRKRISASIILITEGSGEINSEIQIQPGVILYLPAGKECTVAGRDDVVIYQAFCNL